MSRYQRAGVLHSEPPLHPGFRQVSRLRNAAQQRSERGQADQMRCAVQPAAKPATGRRREADAACQSRPRLVRADRWAPVSDRRSPSRRRKRRCRTAHTKTISQSTRPRPAPTPRRAARSRNAGQAQVDGAATQAKAAPRLRQHANRSPTTRTASRSRDPETRARPTTAISSTPTGVSPMIVGRPAPNNPTTPRRERPRQRTIMS